MKKIDLKSLKRIIKYDTLEKYGFIKNKDIYTFKKEIMDNDFEVIISVNNEEINTYVIDKEFDEEYTNVDINTSGEFIGTIKEQYDNTIKEFIEKCTSYDIYYHDQVKEIINYISNKYNDKIEYLWDSSPKSGIFRNKKNNKWYAAILDVKENRISGNSEENIFVIDLMYYKDKTVEVIDNISIYPGYHMNKKSWITIKLNGSVNNDFIYKYIDLSYTLSINK